MSFAAAAIDDVFLGRLMLVSSELCYGVGTALILIELLDLERRNLLAPRWLIYSGDASYAIYLTHMFAIGAAAKVLRLLHGPQRLPAAPAFLLISVTGILDGMLVHRFVGNPAVNVARRLLSV